MGFYGTYGIDSIFIETTNAYSRILDYSIFECEDPTTFEEIAVITNFNLEIPVFISRTCDYVKLITYHEGSISTDFVSFGNYPGSYLDAIEEGESIIYVCFYSIGGTCSFCLDKSPTIGECHDTTGAMGTYSGIVYTPEGPPFTNGQISLTVHNLQAYVQPNGFFSTRVFARRYFFNEIHHYPSSMWYPVDYFTYFLKPDSSYYNDIYTHYYVDIDEEKDDDANSMVVFPNPVASSANFYIKVNELKDCEDLKVLVVDDKGVKCFEQSIMGNQTKVIWQCNSRFAPGVYIYYLINANRIIKTGKLIKI